MKRWGLFQLKAHLFVEKGCLKELLHNNIPNVFYVNYALEFYDYKHSLWHNGEWPLNNIELKEK